LRKAKLKTKEKSMDINEILNGTDDPFTSTKRFNDEVLAPGHYVLETVSQKPYVNVSEAGNRSLTVAFRALSNLKTGEEASGKLIKERLSIDGSAQSVIISAKKFSALMEAYGVTDAAERKAMYLATVNATPAASEVGEKTQTSILTGSGDNFSIEGKQVCASLKVEEYNGRESNKISSVWAKKGE
jgi:hypothetical protein